MFNLASPERHHQNSHEETLFKNILTSPLHTECTKHAVNSSRVVYDCIYCKKTFHLKSLLTYHIKHKHMLQRMHQCKICKKKFARKSMLALHSYCHKSLFLFTSKRKHIKPYKYNLIKRNKKDDIIKRRLRSNDCRKEKQGFNKSERNDILKNNGSERYLQCEICHYSFMYQRGSDFHKEVGTDKCTYECYICSHQFCFLQHFENHRLNIHNLTTLYPTGDHKDTTCKVCKNTFATYFILREHMLSQHEDYISEEEKLFSCGICHIKFGCQENLNIHNLNHNDVKLYSCKFCLAAFASEEILNKHNRTLTDKHIFSCEICDQRFCSISKYKIHMKRHDSTCLDKIRCHLCETEFKSIDQLEEHILKCNHCTEQFCFKKDYNHHIDTHHLESNKTRHAKNIYYYRRKVFPSLMFKCNKCGRMYADKKALKEHRQKSMKDGECRKCGKVFCSYAAYLVHRKGQCNHLCNVCKNTFKNLESFRRHIETHAEKRKANEHLTNQEFTCDECLTVFNSLPNLNEHRHKYTSKRIYECIICHKKVCNLAQIKRHMLFHLKKQSEHFKIIPSFQCKTCQKIFFRYSERRKHLMMHNKEHCRSTMILRKKRQQMKFKCDACDQEFCCASDFDHHNKLHPVQTNANVESEQADSSNNQINDTILASTSTMVSIEPMLPLGSTKIIYKCVPCGKQFSYKGHLNSHYLLIHPEQKHQCTVCFKTYQTFRQFQRHIRVIHLRKANKFTLKEEHKKKKKDVSTVSGKPVPVSKSSVKRSVCKVCAKVFFSDEALLLHQRRNHLETLTDQEKRFPCDLCNERFGVKDQLDIHRLIHEGVKPFKCTVCSLVFKVERTFMTHKRKLTDKNILTCKHCKKQFCSKRWYKDHLATHLLTEAAIAKREKKHAEGLTQREKRYTCTICKEKFVKRDLLDSHQTAKHGIKLYKCPVCLTDFTLERTYLTHKRTLTDKQTYSCEQCDREFCSQKIYKHHVKTHQADDELPVKKLFKKQTQSPKIKIKRDITSDNKKKPEETKLLTRNKENLADSVTEESDDESVASSSSVETDRSDDESGASSSSVETDGSDNEVSGASSSSEETDNNVKAKKNTPEKRSLPKLKIKLPFLNRKPQKAREEAVLLDEDSDEELDDKKVESSENETSSNEDSEEDEETETETDEDEV